MHSSIPSQHRRSPDLQGTSHDVCADVDSQVACICNVGQWCVGNTGVFDHQDWGVTSRGARPSRGNSWSCSNEVMRVEDEVLEARHAR